jgi:hypothetical protein
MNYLKHYNMLIERSQNRVIDGYVEKHHIIPRCLGGTNDTSNIAVLTPEEHFLAHQLLVKIYPNSPPLVNAAVIMTTHHTEHRANNKLFGWLRRRASTYRKEWLKENGHPKGFLGKNHKLEDIDKITAGIRQTAIEKRVSIYAYNLDGTFYKKYESLIECAEDLKTSPSNIKYTAEGKFTHCKGKQIRYDYVESMPPRTSRLAGVKKYNYVCPHCNKEGKGPAMKRFHFDRCKQREIKC